MSSRIKFTKMHGLGNDFVVLDGVTQALPVSRSWICAIVDRHRGIGCDQVLIAEASSKPNVDFNYRIFNANGSESGQCGNGARCLAKFLRDKKLTHKNKLVLATKNTTLVVDILDDENITVDMGLPQQINKHTLHELEFVSLSLGNPHAVTVVRELDGMDIAPIGKLMNEAAYFPEGVNVGFMQIIHKNKIKLRVYERGAGETQACGSGAVAAVVAGCVQGLLDRKVMVELPGGVLKIVWPDEKSSILMTGPAVTVFEGELI